MYLEYINISKLNSNQTTHFENKQTIQIQNSPRKVTGSNSHTKWCALILREIQLETLRTAYPPGRLNGTDGPQQTLRGSGQMTRAQHRGGISEQADCTEPHTEVSTHLFSHLYQTLENAN